MNKRTASGWLLVLACVAYARSASAVDLLTVVEQASDHDAELAASRAASQAARQAVPKARAGLLPQVSGGWGRAYNSTVMDGYPRTSYWQNGWTVSLTQPVFDWSRWTAYRQADVIEARGVVDVARAQQATLVQAVRAYFDALAAEDELMRANDYTAALDVHFAQLRRRRAAGEATVIDLQEAEAAREQARLQSQDASSDLQLKRLTLEQITGQPFAALSRLSETAPMPGIDPVDADSWARQAEANDYLVQLKQIDWRIAKLEVEKARARHLPVVNLSASHTPAGAASGYSRPTTTSTAMVSVTIPLFEGGEANAIVDEKLALEDKAQDELLAAQRMASGTAREYWSRFRAGVVRVDALTRLVQTSRAALDATQIGYKVGSRTSADVLRASDALYANRRDLIRARYSTIVALLQLKAATASLDFDEVARVNGLLVAGSARAAGAASVRDAASGGAVEAPVRKVVATTVVPMAVGEAVRVGVGAPTALAAPAPTPTAPLGAARNASDSFAVNALEAWRASRSPAQTTLR
ncbi:TolC family outer membrane protein [Paraburkholderia sp.]|uniref:TolC family outer membrane protein n=1 Tax=Paraburkholderia sp. TaxID=1926495 RepID=UPI002389AD83|nr:TolC family outer membrane protein [Paraburkholderia sp.]MDE1183576.1 TolC family outer membrane protein [Paraburkholderia sp.]